MTASRTLFSPTQFGAISIRNRIVMAPLTRQRTEPDGVPTSLHVDYYAQRAGLGLIVTEGTWPSITGRSWLGQPGIVTAEQIEGWRAVADAVHARGGKIVMQLMHGGRMSHPSISGGRVLAPSAIAAPGEVRTPEGKHTHPVPDAMTVDDIRLAVDEHVDAARNAIAAGLDGVEIHAANGYLIHEFLAPSTNTRTDEYGGSPESRARFAVEIVAAVAAAVGADRTGIRISPSHNIQGVIEDDEDDVRATYGALAAGLAPLGLAFVDILHADPAGDLIQDLRRTIEAPAIVNTGFVDQTDRDSAQELVHHGHADAVAVGRAAIANPDLIDRWATGAQENPVDPDTFYTGGPRGYVDYPTLDDAA